MLQERLALREPHAPRRPRQLRPHRVVVRRPMARIFRRLKEVLDGAPVVQSLLEMDGEFGSNLSGAIDTYSKLIKKGRFLDEVIFDLRDALYRFPVDVNIWQSLGDAYMRANRLQDALDAYTKAEELLR